MLIHSEKYRVDQKPTFSNTFLGHPVYSIVQYTGLPPMIYYFGVIKPRISFQTQLVIHFWSK